MGRQAEPHPAVGVEALAPELVHPARQRGVAPLPLQGVGD